jgi:hypothetical protein
MIYGPSQQSLSVVFKISGTYLLVNETGGMIIALKFCHVGNFNWPFGKITPLRFTSTPDSAQVLQKM